MATTRDCAGNPINYVDPTGHYPEWFVNLFIEENGKEFKNLTSAEKKLVYSNPLGASKAKDCADLARKVSRKVFGYHRDGSKQNAFQHAYWNALMAFSLGKSVAESFATAHEKLKKNKLNKKGAGGFLNKTHCEMDYHNNKVGRKIGIKLMKNMISYRTPHTYLHVKLKRMYKTDAQINKFAGIWGVKAGAQLILAANTMKALTRGRLKTLT